MTLRMEFVNPRAFHKLVYEKRPKLQVKFRVAFTFFSENQPTPFFQWLASMYLITNLISE
jgi:hypothetical protein